MILLTRKLVILIIAMRLKIAITNIYGNNINTD